MQRCTVDKHRNLIAHAPERLHEEIGADYTDMIYAATPEDIATRRKAFVRKWRLKHRPVADSLEEAGDRLFTFTQLPPSQWRSARTTNAIERLRAHVRARSSKVSRVMDGDILGAPFSGQRNRLPAGIVRRDRPRKRLGHRRRQAMGRCVPGGVTRSRQDDRRSLISETIHQPAGIRNRWMH